MHHSYLEKGFIACFVLYILIFGLSLLDGFSVIDYDTYGLETVIVLTIAITFFVGTTLGILRLLFAPPELIERTKTLVKYVVILYYIFSPLAFVVFLLAVLNGIGGVEMRTLFLFLLPSLIVLTLIILTIIPIANFKSSWSKAKKVFFAIFTAIINLIAATLICAATGMVIVNDHGIS